MKSLLNKELKLSTPLLTFLFISFSVMTFIPGYPILCGAFFVCFGLFQRYQYDREANDIMYSVMLPVSKREVVKAKFLADVTIEMIAFVLFAAFTVIRMAALSDTAVFKANVLMAANPVFLAFVLIIFAAFNGIFTRGFFKTAYGLGKPFIGFIIVCFLIIGVAETLHHLPGLGFLNASGGEMMWIQLVILIVAAVLYIIITMLSCKNAQKNFEQIDL